MKVEQFERMIEESGLRHILTMSYQLRFIVCLEISGRFQNDTLEFGRAEFEAMDDSLAQSHIDACCKRLERATRTQQGTIAYPKAQPQRSQKIPQIATVQTVGYPAH